MRHFCSAWSLVLAAFASLPGQAASTPESMLTTALKGPTNAFEGTQTSIVYLDAGPVTTEVTVYGDGKGRIRREYRKGAAAGVVVFQSGPVVWQRDASGSWLRLPGSPLPDARSTAARIVRNYAVSAGPAAKLAGRSVVPLKIQARTAYNPSRQMWVDRTTGIIVKDEFLAPGGRVRSSTTFTRLRIGPQSKSLFAAPARSAEPALFGPSSFRRYASAAEVERISGFPVLLPRHVPAGYSVETHGVMSTRNGRTMPAVRYSDGLSSFTVFQRGPGAGPGGRGRGQGGQGRGQGRRGGPGGGGGWGRGQGGPGGGAGMQNLKCNRQMSVVAVSSERANYLLVGDLAEAELRRVADSLP